MVQLVYFAWVRERMGVSEEAVALPDAVTTVASLIDWLSARDVRGAAALADRGRLRAAIDGTFVGLDAEITDAREIAIFPPVTGG